MSWIPTKRRGPIAGEYTSPGPRYSLPSLTGQSGHDNRSTYFRAPAYHFGLKRVKFTDDCSPGPAYLPHPKVTREGMDGMPQISLSSRHGKLTQLNVPGPGTYSPEHSGAQAHYKHPAYSFGLRHRQRTSDSAPGANRYSLPTVLGKTYQSGIPQAPCYSMVGRSKTGGFHQEHQKTPGAGTYKVTAPELYMNKSPRYSMKSRNIMPGDSTKKPGPGAHTIPEPGMIKERSAAFSFGIRHSRYTTPLIIDAPDKH